MENGSAAVLKVIVQTNHVSVDVVVRYNDLETVNKSRHISMEKQTLMIVKLLYFVGIYKFNWMVFLFYWTLDSYGKFDHCVTSLLKIDDLG